MSSTPPRPQADAAAPMVQTTLGALRGQARGLAEVFRGIPYAAPPLGALRWRSPAAPAPWAGVRDATRDGPDCVRNQPLWEPCKSGLPMSEDCLTLNVWRPAGTTAGARLPVMVWVHGGGLVMGSGSQPIYSGGHLCQRGVLVVSFNYRLGRLGFFAHPALHEQDQGYAGGNYGLQDQLALLRWVQQHIECFGGDPGCVTVFGESAGGHSVLLLMQMAAARGLFHRAIAQSAPVRERGVPLQAEGDCARVRGEAMARSLHLRQPDANALRAVAAERLLGRLDLLNLEPSSHCGLIRGDGLVHDGVLQQLPAALRDADPVPLMIGANSSELGHLPAMVRRPLLSTVLKQLDCPRAALEQAYGGSAEMQRELPGDYYFVEPARALAGALADAGHPVWLYHFDHVPAAQRAAALAAGLPPPGARHTGEIPYVFGTLSDATDLTGPTGAEDQALAATLVALWADFARHGHPWGGGRPHWPRYANDSQAMRFNHEGMCMAPLRLRVLDTLSQAHSRASLQARSPANDTRAAPGV